MTPSVCRGWSGGCADGSGNPAVPRSFDVAHECRVDDEVTERLDEGHVGGAEPAEEVAGRPQQARRPRRRIGAALTGPVDKVIQPKTVEPALVGVIRIKQRPCLIMAAR